MSPFLYSPNLRMDGQGSSLPWGGFVLALCLGIGAGALVRYGVLLSAVSPSVTVETAPVPLAPVEPTVAVTPEPARPFELVTQLVMPPPQQWQPTTLERTMESPERVEPSRLAPTHVADSNTNTAAVATTTDPLWLALEQVLADFDDLSLAPPETEAPTAAALRNVVDQVPVASTESPALAALIEPTDPALSPVLQQALADALAELGMNLPITANSASSNAAEPPNSRFVADEQIPKLGQLSLSFQKQLPDLEISAHVFATEPTKRLVRANGRELQEGDEAAPGVKIKEILPNEVVLEMNQQAFRVPALGRL
ncbi:MAG: general secretion pathway protein GspB [Ferrimonas sp.]